MLTALLTHIRLPHGFAKSPHSPTVHVRASYVTDKPVPPPTPYFSLPGRTKAVIGTRIAALGLCALLDPMARRVVSQDPPPPPAAMTAAFRGTGIVNNSAAAPAPDADLTF